VLTPSVDAFTALARSSPWRWSTLRFTLRWPRRSEVGAVRAWLRRPDRLRIEDLGGALLQVVHEPRPQATLLTTHGGLSVVRPWAGAPPVALRPDGLVADRPAALGYDAPFYANYFWVALLDPVELADGRDPDDGAPDGPALQIDELAEVDHGGRRAWEAVVRPTPRYAPRCGCCPLLRTHEVDELEYSDQPEYVLPVYPDAFVVRLDVETGVCVSTEEVGGLTPGEGHHLRIEAVDEPMGDDLFVQPPPPKVQWGWNQYPGPT
jgi:hypothetical protein